MLIDRNVAITADAKQTVPTINLATDGTALTKQAITVTGAPADDDVAQTTVYLITANDFAEISTGSDATSIVLPPATLVEATNREYVNVFVADATTSQDNEVDDPTITQFAMLPALTGVTFTGPTASWTTLPQATLAHQDLYVNATIANEADVDMSPSWIAATGATSVAFDDSAPGWQAAWSFWKTATYSPSFSIEVDTQTTYATSSVNPAAPAIGLRAPHRSSPAERLRRRR